MVKNTLEVLLKNSISPKVYLIHRYINFISNCNICNKFTSDVYTEIHHIIPKSFGGSNDLINLIKLNARQHFIAHLLLAKATNSPKMIKALHKMVYSVTGDVKRTYKINNRIYSYLRIEHSKIVSNYSKNTVVARQIYTSEIKRIPKLLFEKYKDILYESISKGRKDSLETRLKKSIASKLPRKVTKGLESRRNAASKWSYHTPKGFCKTSGELLKYYPTFSKNTLTIVNNNSIITYKFASIHKEFSPYIGFTFEQYGITKFKRS